ncbi:hypothetical protein YC2023_095373 [Brassica napus]
MGVCIEKEKEICLKVSQLGYALTTGFHDIKERGAFRDTWRLGRVSVFFTLSLPSCSHALSSSSRVSARLFNQRGWASVINLGPNVIRSSSSLFFFFPTSFTEIFPFINPLLMYYDYDLPLRSPCNRLDLHL